jgi:predicted ATPase/transcriptional regulator with XRE-family HTH domain
MSNSFASLLRQHRQMAGLSQAELAERAGLSQRAISDLERGMRRAPYPATIRHLAEALGLSEGKRIALMQASRRAHAQAAAQAPGTASEGRPRPDTPSESRPRLDNLPREVTSFVGRGEELLELQRLAGRGPCLTLTGLGGVGKTRLALRLAHDLLPRYPDGVWLVELASVTDAGLVPQSIAEALGVAERPGVPVAERVVEHLANRRTLLLLDNCEHLLLTCAELIGRLLRLNSGLHVLVTSREPLRIPGETTWRVAPLVVADARDKLAAAANSEAVQLFVDRAQACVPSFTLSSSNLESVVAICQAVDGLPLAIELAAARLKLLSPERLHERLQDSLRLLTAGSRTAPSRQRTLRGMLDWSYELLPSQDRLLFERLSVFAGGWTLEAAEQVGGVSGVESAEPIDGSGHAEATEQVGARGEVEASAQVGGSGELESAEQVGGSGDLEDARQVGGGGELYADDVLERLAQLVDASLVQADPGADGEPRYRFLQTVHQYSREKLSDRGEQQRLDARRRHAMHFRDLVERSGQDLLGPQQAVEFERLEREHDNLRAALSFALDRGELDLGLRLAAGLVRFWTIRCHFSEGRKWFERCIDLAQRQRGAKVDRDALATLLNGAGNFATMRGEFAVADELLRQSLQLRRELGDQMGAARTLLNLGNVAFSRGDHATATRLFQESLDIRRQLGDTRGTARVLNNLSVLARDGGHVERMTYLADEALVLSRQVGDQEGIALALVSLGVAAHLRHEFADAMEHLKRSLSLFAELRHWREIAECIELIAGVCCKIGQLDRAGRLLGAAEALIESVGLVPLPADRFEYQRTIAALRTALGDDGLTVRWAEGRALTPDSAIADALGAGAQ